MLSIVTLLLVATIHRALSDDSTSQLDIDHLKHHERVYFNQTDRITSSNLMEFDAFNHHYVIQLDLVEHLIPNNVIQHHPPSEDEIEPYYTSLTKSCHYYGRVLNTDEPDAYAVLSFCPRRGIRGHVQAFGDKIYIKPTAAYHTQFRHSDINEEHLLYRSSDEIIDPFIPHRHKTKPTLSQSSDTTGSRRRLAYNGGRQTVQVLVVNGAARTKYYKDNKGSSWKQEMNSDYGEMFSLMNRPYSSASWDSNIGSVTLVMSQLDILEDYNSIGVPRGERRASFNNKPCNGASDMLRAQCSVDCENYCDKTANYIRRHSGFDTAALVDLVPFEYESRGGGWSGTLGLAEVGSVCRRDSASVNFDSSLHSGVRTSSDTTAATVAHEIGHNLNMEHDGSRQDEGNGCDEKYLMGAGSISNGFSSCSRNEVLQGFKRNGGWSCLNGGGDGDNSVNTGGDNNNPGNDDNDNYDNNYDDNNNWNNQQDPNGDNPGSNNNNDNDYNYNYDSNYNYDNNHYYGGWYGGWGYYDYRAFNMEDDCSDKVDAMQIVINGGDDLWSGTRQFNLIDGRCSYKHPVFATAMEEHESEEDRYYLHFVPDTHEGEWVGQWVISQEDVYVIGNARCIQYDVSKCGANTWNVKSRQGDDMRFIPSERLAVVHHNENEKEDTTVPYEQMVGIIAIVCILVIGLVVCLVVGKKKSDPKIAIEDESEDDVDIEVEIDGEMLNNTTGAVATN